MGSVGLIEPNTEAVAAFWNVARKNVSWARIEPFLGPPRLASIQPPAVQLANGAEQATQLALQVAEGELTELTEEMEDPELIPAFGDLMIICDGEGYPRALAQTTKVEVDGKKVVETISSIYPKQAKGKK